MRTTLSLDDRRQLDGAVVVDTHGEKVGTVHGYDEAGSYLVVTKGLFFPKDTFVPFAAVDTIDADGVHLTLSQEELRAELWTSAPDPVSGSAQAVAGQPGAGIAAERDATAAVVEGDLRIPLHQEEMVVASRQVEAARVHIRKTVVNEQATITVPLRQEQVTIERVALTGDLDPAMVRDAFVERDYEITLLGEELQVGKRVVGVEEVVVQKDVTTVREQVSDTVRREQVHVAYDGQPEVVTGAAEDAIMGQRNKKRARRR